MSLPPIIRHTLLTGLALLLAAPGWGADERLLSPAEVAGMDRENAMWRLVKPDEGATANLARLRQAGYSEDEVAALQPQLAALWAVPYQRNYGWLRPETVERIQAIDREFVRRIRAAHVFSQTGIQVGESARETPASINRQWRDAILEGLNVRESAEFRLMNSALARDEARLAKGLVLTADEQRTLFVWRQDYEGRHGVSLGTTTGLSRWQRQDLLDQCRQLRDLLGDDRFAVYFSRANPGFDRMRATLVRLGESNATAMLDLWWLRQKEAVAIDRIIGLTAEERVERITRLRDRAADMLGDRLAGYLEDEDGRWLTTNVRPRKVVSAQVSRRSPEPPPVERKQASPEP